MKLGLTIALAGNIAAVGLTLPVLGVPPGTHIRPMGWAFMIACLAVVMMGAGLVANALDFARGFYRSAAIGALLSLTPFPVAAWTLVLIASLRGLYISK